jgi:hypothetical protein
MTQDYGPAARRIKVSLIAASFPEAGGAVHSSAAPWTRRKVDQVFDCCQSCQDWRCCPWCHLTSTPNSAFEEALGVKEIQSTPIVNSLNVWISLNVPFVAWLCFVFALNCFLIFVY